MAKRNSTSKLDRARKGGSHRGTRPPRSSPSANGVGSDAPETGPTEDFGGERTRLMKAEAVLHCLTVSLNYSSWYPVDGTTYAMAVDVARDLVQESMDRLEQRDRKIETGKRRPS
jgi:hypothetical protein